MSDVIRFATPRRQDRGELHAGWLDGGTLVVYDAPVPADGDEALTTQTALVIFTLENPSGVVTDGVFVAETLATALILETGTAAFARAYDSLDAAIGDYDVGGVGSGEAVELDNLSLAQGAYATVISFTVTEG